MLEGILAGLSTAASPLNLMMVAVGCFVGTFIGMLPGLGPISAIALMIPITYGFDPATGLILMAGVYYGAIFGGSTSSILINAPGVAGTVATAFDGYPMAKQGKAGKALAIAAYSSFSGGTIAAIFLLVAAPSLATVSLAFQSTDYFALMVLGLTAVAAFAGRGQIVKALLMTVLGLMLSTVGTDETQGVQRFTFGMIDLLDGVSFLLLAMATFALSEALMAVLRPKSDADRRREMEAQKNLGSMKLTRGEVKEMAPVVGRSSVLGFFIGVLPGAGATIASFLAYGMEQRLAGPKKGAEFGKGSIRGLSAPETANNAACSGSFVPLLTLGIPHGDHARRADLLRHPAGPAALRRQPRGVLVGDHLDVHRHRHPAGPEPALDPLHRPNPGDSLDHPDPDDRVLLADRRLLRVVQHLRHPPDGDLRDRRGGAAAARLPDGADAARFHPRRHDGGEPAPGADHQQRQLVVSLGALADPVDPADRGRRADRADGGAADHRALAAASRERRRGRLSKTAVARLRRRQPPVIAIRMPAKTAGLMTPLMLAPSACGRMTASGVTSATVFCATLAVVGRQLTPAMPMTGLNLRPVTKYST
jgi:TctA family transporter